MSRDGEGGGGGGRAADAAPAVPTAEGTGTEFAEYGPRMEEVAEFVNSCNSFSELVDRLCIENVRLWHILDDTAALKRELEAAEAAGDKARRTEILERIAKKSFENIESVKRRSSFKRAIDESLRHSIGEITRGGDPNVCIESKSYGR